jgi:hypothetical protein
MMSILPMVAKRILVLILLGVVLSACAIIRTEPLQKIALLAPFEGQSRAIGYNALYAVRLGLTENNDSTLNLLAIDDGGTLELARQRAQAIRQDDSVQIVFVLGEFASDARVLEALAPLQVIQVMDVQTPTTDIPTEFRERYLASDIFVPEPTQIALKSYYATLNFLETR